MQITAVDTSGGEKQSSVAEEHNSEVKKLNPETERWPTIYDWVGLKAQIEVVIKDQTFEKKCYEDDEHCTEDELFFGDIIKYKSPIITTDDDGNIEHYTFDDDDENHHWWMVLGNTCDMARSIADAPLTYITPIISIAKVPNLINKYASIAKYETSRVIMVPRFDALDVEKPVIDLYRMMSIRRTALVRHAKKQKQLSFFGSMLLHCCMVRFLARDDGRNDRDGGHAEK